MKLNISYIPNTFNYGSCMMAISVIKHLKDAIRPLEFYVDCRTPEDLDRLKKETQTDTIYTSYQYDALEKTDHINGQGIHIILGGDSVSEYYGLWKIKKRLQEIKVLSKDNKVFLLGQSVGPFTDARIPLAQDCLKDVSIYTRSLDNYLYLQSLGLKHIVHGVDLAFCKLPLESSHQDILSKYNLTPNNYITLVPSGLYKKYTTNLEAYVQEYLKIITSLLCSPKFMDKKILLLPHVTVSGSDIDIINELLSKLSPLQLHHIVPITSSLLPSQARTLLGNGLFTITGRMHAAVSTFYMKKPALALSYSIKYQGVLGEYLNSNNLIIESNDPTLWENHHISTAAFERSCYILDHYPSLISTISERTDQSKWLLAKEMESFITEIRSLQK